MKKISLPIILILLAIVGCGKEEDRVLASVGNETIKVKDFLAAYSPQVFPGEEAELEAKQKVLAKIIDEKLIVAEAKSRGYDKDSTLEAGMKDTYDNALISALYTKEVIDKGKASRSDAKRFYDADKVLLKLNLIHMETDSMAYRVLEDFASGVPFETLAVRFSSHPSSRNGGAIGTMPLSTFYGSPAFVQLSKVKQGRSTLPIESDIGGVDIFYVAERTEKKDQPPFKDIEADIIRRIETIRQSKLSQESLERLLAEAKIEYNNTGLSLLSKPLADLTKTDLSTWTIKVGGKVVDSVGSMLMIYERFPEGLPSQQIQGFAERIAQRPALVQVAQKRHLENDPIVKEAIERFVDSQVRNRLYREEVSEKVTVSPEEVREYYDQHLDEFKVPERRKLSIIRTSVYSDIQQAYALLRQGRPFEEAAKQFSDHQQSASRGGSIGFRGVDDVSFKPFVEQAFKLGKGTYSRPFEVYNGFGIVMVDDIQEGYTRDFETEQSRIERRIRKEKEDTRKEELLNELRAKFPVKINEKLLLQIAKVEQKPETDSQGSPAGK